MKPKIKIVVSVAGVLSAAAIATTLGILLAPKNNKKGGGACAEACAEQLCGTVCDGDDPGCVGTRCEDPAATCYDGVCLKNYSCSPDGACVLDPDGVFRGDTCKCFAVAVNHDTGEQVCEVVGDEKGVYKSSAACEARNADFQCVPGTGTCERVLGASTGWRFETDCACFECNNLACVPTQSTNPGEAGIDEEACAECGLWKCDDGGACVQVRNGEGGVWKEPADCACGACVDGGCAPSEGGGIYTTVAACEADGGSQCSNPALGWACSSNAGNPQACEQVIGGTAATLEDCRCWTCAGTPPGPTSGCVVDYTNAGEYASGDDCLLDEERKCGWRYGCAYTAPAPA